MKALCMSLVLALAACGTIGCREEGPAERAGRQIDEALEEAQDTGEGRLERAGEDLDEALEDAGDAIDEAAEDVREAVEGAGK